VNETLDQPQAVIRDLLARVTDSLNRDRSLAMLSEIYSDADTEPPLGWEAVYAFEAEHRIILPEPYRSFVALITTGGEACGPPYYGLLAPGARHYSWPDYGPIALDEPFPLTEAWIWEDNEVRGDGITPEDVYTRGALPLGTDGDGLFWVLIVTGPHRGHVWCITDVGAQPFGREFGFTTGDSGFLGWVTHWFSGSEWWDAPL
jgi:hypothetical protein